ncbi:hypothetical protein HELRODRAFT_189698 [Helobdella robusta]|uniref:G-protein coupled receptors family 1 profile domain-containing protein n=1 Tax=Helobdella robusta TaxID=6412 RepID=T1FR98_HELRO|nr:hypothetical protein HELRODRAFT_189698 [Helobdella robusta]ESN91460.1 hypothetical protein HELRODRAFT_189698 [Helobdella robusta]
MDTMQPSTLAPTITKHLLNFPFNFTDGNDEKLRTFLLHHEFTDSCHQPTNNNFDHLVRLQLFYNFFTYYNENDIIFRRQNVMYNNFTNVDNIYNEIADGLNIYSETNPKYTNVFHFQHKHLNDDSFNYTLLNSEEQTHADPRQAHNSNDISHASYDEPTASYINTFILTYIPLIIYIVGVLGNSLSLSVLVRKRMRRVSTYTYLSVLSVVDTLVLTMGLLQLWIGERSNLGWLRDQSNVACKTLNVFSYSMSDLSVWLIIAVTVERFIAVCHPLRAASMCRRRTALKVMLALTSLMLLLNSHFILTTKVSVEEFSTYEITEEGTNLCSSVKKSRCMAAGGHEDFIQKYWPWVDAIFYSFLPFVMIISLNCMIIRRVMVARRRRWKMISQSSVSVNRSDATSAHLHQHQLNEKLEQFHKSLISVSYIVSKGTGGVGVMVREELGEKVFEVRRKSNGVIVVVMVFGKIIVRVIYQDMLRNKAGLDEFVVLLGDLNGHVGADADGYESVHRGWGFGIRNEEGRRVLELADAIAWLGEHRSMIDYILVRAKHRKYVRNVKAIPVMIKNNLEDEQTLRHKQNSYAISKHFKLKRQEQTICTTPPDNLLRRILRQSKNHRNNPTKPGEVAVSTVETSLSPSTNNHQSADHSTVRGLHSSQHRHQAKLTHQSASRLSSVEQASRMEQNETNRMLSIMLLTISFAFILMTLPRNIYFLFVYWSNYSKHSELLSSPGSADEDALGKNISSSEGGAGIYNDDQSHTHANLLLASTLTEMLMFLNHSSNFFLYCATGQKFRMELKKMLLSWRSCLLSALCHLLCCFPSSHTTACKKRRNMTACCRCCVERGKRFSTCNNFQTNNRNSLHSNKKQKLKMLQMNFHSCHPYCDGVRNEDRDCKDYLHRGSIHIDLGSNKYKKSLCNNTVVINLISNK